MRSSPGRAAAVAAVACGVWALGAVAANAATLPGVPDTDALTTGGPSTVFSTLAPAPGQALLGADGVNRSVGGSVSSATGRIGGLTGATLPTD
jgi:hypothetical protein